MSALADDAPRGFVRMADYLKLQKHCDDLEAKLQTANDLAASESLGQRPLEVKARLSLSASQALLVCQLLDGVATTERMLCLLQRFSRGNEETDPKSVLRTQLSHIRRRLEGQGCPPPAVYCHRRLGYALTNDAREWLAGFMPQIFSQGASR